MALTKEDKKDVQGAMGKALANKVEKATRDSSKTASAVKSFGRSIKRENVSYGELAEMSHPKYKKHLMRDPRLAEAAGISEEDYNKYHSTNSHYYPSKDKATKDKTHNEKGERIKAETFGPGSRFTVVPSHKSQALAKKAGKSDIYKANKGAFGKGHADRMAAFSGHE